MRRLALALLALGLVGLTAVAADDEEWEARIQRELIRLETKAGAFDGKKASTGTLKERLIALDERVGDLESARGLAVGDKIELADSDLLNSMTVAVVRIESRLRRIEKGDEEESDPLEEDEGADEAPRKPESHDPEWPDVLSFSASGTIDYVATGSWYSEFDEFLQDGWSGNFNVTLRTTGLKREIREAYIVLVVHPQSIFKPFLQDVTWKAETRMYNGAKRTWMKLTSGGSRGPVRWISKTASSRRHGMPCRVEAIVVFVIDKKGKRIDFSIPSYVAKALQGIR